MYVQANIGRNINGVPMSDIDWEQFKADVIVSLRCSSMLGGDIYHEVHTGVGIWDGVAEESAKISAYCETGFNLESLRHNLEVDRVNHKQESIALIVGSELIEGE